jgi:transcriptional regulator with XRE-family HTH domain
VTVTTQTVTNVSHSQIAGEWMLSKTLQDGLNDYRIGPKVRALRLKKKIGLVDLGQHTGLSPALLSKIERGRLFPTLPTLLRIALVFGVGLEYFFAGAREQPLVAVTRKDQRVELPERPDARDAAYRFASLDYPATERRFNCYHAEFFPVAPEHLRPHAHDGVEFVYVIEGTLSVHMDDSEHVLEAGDAMYFDASNPHAYRRSGASACTAVVVTAA